VKLRGPLGTLIWYEILQVLRDRRTLLIVVVAPLILYPLLIAIGRVSEERGGRALQARTYQYAVTGSAENWAREVIRRAVDRSGSGGEVAADSEPGTQFDDSTGGLLPGSSQPGALRLEERTVSEPDSALRAGAIDLVVRATRPSEGTPGRDRAEADVAEESAPTITLLYRSNSDYSRAAYQDMDRRLRRARAEERDSVLRSAGFPLETDHVAAIEESNLATIREEGGARLAVILTPLMVMLMMGGGALVAADAISGEKERGTLETLLTTAATRGQIVSAKLLSIAVVGLAVTVINLANLLAYLVLGLIEIPDSFAVDIPLPTLGMLFLLYLPVIVLVAAALLLVSGYAKTYKEYQIYAIPLTFVCLIPALAAALPGAELRSVVAAIPLAGVSVAVREVLSGDYDWMFLALAFSSTAGAAGWATKVTAGFLSRERLVTPGDLDQVELTGGEPLFRRRVLRWFGILWVLLLVTSLWLQGDLGLRAQAIINLVGFFLGGSLLMIRHYGLDVRRALSLRVPHPAVWIAVAIGVPAAQLTGIAVSRGAEFFFPVPQEVVEAFGQYVLPEGVPLWQILFFFCLLPGICEEIAFRGVLLYGLRKKLTPFRLALVVGLIFGLFHVDLFRIVPTAYLGVILTAVVLLSGSILPAVAWHTLNNAFALVSSQQGFALESVSPSLIWLGGAGLAVSGWILWRTRRPYPGLRRGAEP